MILRPGANAGRSSRVSVLGLLILTVLNVGPAIAQRIDDGHLHQGDACVGLATAGGSLVVNLIECNGQGFELLFWHPDADGKLTRLEWHEKGCLAVRDDTLVLDEHCVSTAWQMLRRQSGDGIGFQVPGTDACLGVIEGNLDLLPCGGNGTTWD